MKDYNWIKRTIESFLKDSDWIGDDPAVHASVVHDELDHGTNENINVSYEDIAAVAMKEGYQVYRVKHGYYGDDDYLLMVPNYSLDKYRRHWQYEMDDIDEVLEGAHKLFSLEDIYKQD